ncbi:MAG TPA: sugar phosphate isomerase/epimerase [Nitrososphaerales archaeon]|nr:sugar phosphate isomerase/epimerase [Nitrososphaerales archaeon]
MNSAVRMIGDAGLEYVEIWGEVPHAYPAWVDRKKLKDTLSTYKMYVTAHAPFTDLNPASPFQPVKGAVEHTLEDFISFAEYLGVSMVTVHPGSVHSEALVPQSVQSSISTLKRVVRAGGGRLTVNVENQAKSNGHYHFPLCSTLESLELIIAEVDGLHFTLDTSHAHVNGQRPLELAERLGSMLAEVHLSDNSGSTDDHLVPGEGNAPLGELLNKLSIGELPVCLEIDPYRYTEEQVMSAAVRMKDALRRS